MDYERDYKELIDHADIMMLDTCFAMNDAFPIFVDEIETELLAYEKKIIVRYYVLAELFRKMRSDNKYTSERATRAIEIICMRRNIFDVDERSITAEEIIRAFADAELLAELTKARIKNRTILFTNDYKLGCDANNLNNLGSCYGKKIKVFGLDKDGLLYEKKNEPEVIEPVIEVEDKDEANHKKVPEMKHDMDMQHHDFGPIIITSVLSFFAGIAVNRVWERNAKKLIKKVA